jgi:GGDEF domain-containing protein
VAPWRRSTAGQAGSFNPVAERSLIACAARCEKATGHCAGVAEDIRHQMADQALYQAKHQGRNQVQ